MFTLFNTQIRTCQCCQLYVNVINSMDRWMDRLDGWNGGWMDIYKCE